MAFVTFRNGYNVRERRHRHRMEIIDRIIRSAKRRDRRERAVSRISTGFWGLIDCRGCDLAIVGDRRAVRNLLRFADKAHRSQISCIIPPRQIEKLVPELNPKNNSEANGVDLIVIPHQGRKKSVSDTVRKHLRHDIPIFILYEDQLISYRKPGQNPTFDLNEDRTLPEKTYIVASSGRTGSTMLCELLQRTGVLGYPNEYIGGDLSVLAEERLIDPGYVLTEIVKEHQTPNGVFGIKVHWSSLRKFNRTVFPILGKKEQKIFENLLNNSGYIFLSRRNKIMQAISDWRAMGTGVFHSCKNSNNGSREQYGKRLQYDHPRLKQHLVSFVHDDQGWRDYFKTNNIDPIEIAYEEMVKKPEEAVDRILSFLSEDYTNPDITPNTNRMADEYTEEIYERFVQDLEREYGKDMVKRLEGVEPVSDRDLKRGQRKNHVLVTLATRDYIDKAKQVFSSAYFNGGWDGDYLLLAHDIPEEELSWFRERDIIIKHATPLYEGRPGGMHPCIADKFYMFTPDFKKWRTVIYSDLDVIVKESLDELKEVKGFWAVEDWVPALPDQIVDDQDIDMRGLDREECGEVIQEVEQRYEMSRRPFCAGFFAFSTDIITDSMFGELKKTMDRYHMISKYGDQLSFNLFLYDQWKKLSPTFNVLVTQETSDDSTGHGFEAHTRWGVAEDVNAYLFHIFNPKPWNENSSFYWEWLMNLKRADQIGLCKVDKDFERGIENIKRTEKSIRLREKTYRAIERSGPFKGTAINILNFVYWRYITLRKVAYFIASRTESLFIKKILGKGG